MEKNEEYFIKIIQSIDQGACLLKNRSIIYKNPLFDQSIIDQEVSSLLKKDGSLEQHSECQSENKIRYAKKILLGQTYSIILLSSKKDFEFKIDPLTGLLSRECIDKISLQLVDDAINFNKILSFLFISIDGIKAVTDKLGQENANIVLKKCAAKMNYATRANDFCFRFGENEFVIILTDIKDKMDSCIVASRLVSSISEPISLETGDAVSISANIGISCYPVDDSDINKVIDKAEKTMHLSIKSGINNYQIHD
ncbi:MAG: GGDEF domain-containing protein [Proteobacteria bacterium]|nr:GGDEF domain-containing protein [Pseudomonadota bacterium]